jgi:hypothetical protein
MYGFQIGTLEFSINRSDLLWTKSGKQKNQWLLAEIELPSGEYIVIKILK